MASARDILNLSEMRQAYMEQDKIHTVEEKKVIEEWFGITEKLKGSNVLILDNVARTNIDFEKFNELCFQLIALNIGRTWSLVCKVSDLFSIFNLFSNSVLPKPLLDAKINVMTHPTPANNAILAKNAKEYSVSLAKMKDIYMQSKAALQQVIQLNAPESLLQKLSLIQAQFDRITNSKKDSAFDVQLKLLGLHLDWAGKFLAHANVLHNDNLQLLRRGKDLVNAVVSSSVKILTAKTISDLTLTNNSPTDDKKIEATGKSNHSLCLSMNPSALLNKPKPLINQNNSGVMPHVSNNQASVSSGHSLPVSKK